MVFKATTARSLLPLAPPTIPNTNARPRWTCLPLGDHPCPQWFQIKSPSPYPSLSQMVAGQSTGSPSNGGTPFLLPENPTRLILLRSPARVVPLKHSIRVHGLVGYGRLCVDVATSCNLYCTLDFFTHHILPCLALILDSRISRIRSGFCIIYNSYV